MKKIFLLATLLAMISCSKEIDLSGNHAPQETAEIELSFKSPESRAFGAGTTETWEKSVKSAMLMIFNSSSKLLFQKALTSAEITSIQTTPLKLVLPGVTTGEICEFVVVANRSVVSAATVKTQTDADCAAYNGTFAQVTTLANRTNGFAMSGTTKQAIAAATTSVAITLKRLVAKIEVNTTTSAAFALKYPGLLTINKTTISRSAENSYVIPNSSVSASSYAFTHEQTSTSGRNLFYIFESPAKAANSRVLLTIYATYDADGSGTTTADQIPFEYLVELTGSTGGQIVRNGSYLININIDGLIGSGYGVTVTIANWETLATQNITVG